MHAVGLWEEVQRERMQTQQTSKFCTEKPPGGSNPEPSCCELTVVTTAPLCHLYGKTSTKSKTLEEYQNIDLKTGKWKATYADMSMEGDGMGHTWTQFKGSSSPVLGEID